MRSGALVGALAALLLVASASALQEVAELSAVEEAAGGYSEERTRPMLGDALSHARYAEEQANEGVAKIVSAMFQLQAAFTHDLDQRDHVGGRRLLLSVKKKRRQRRKGKRKRRKKERKVPAPLQKNFKKAQKMLEVVNLKVLKLKKKILDHSMAHQTMRTAAAKNKSSVKWAVMKKDLKKAKADVVTWDQKLQDAFFEREKFLGQAAAQEARQAKIEERKAAWKASMEKAAAAKKRAGRAKAKAAKAKSQAKEAKAEAAVDISKIGEAKASASKATAVAKGDKKAVAAASRELREAKKEERNKVEKAQAVVRKAETDKAAAQKKLQKMKKDPVLQRTEAAASPKQTTEDEERVK